MNSFLIIIPAYNEEKNLGGVIQSIKDQQIPADILVINDGSTDLTAFIAKEKEVIVISHPTNLGVGSAIQTGYRYAAKREYPYVIVFDADGQHDPIYLSTIMKAIEYPESDIVIGSRFLMDSFMKVGVFKLLAIRLFRFLIYFVTKKKITDPTSGFRAFKFHVYKRLTKSNNFPTDFPDTNFIIETLLNHDNIVEIPVNMFDRKHGKSMHSGLKPVIYMFQLLLSILILIIRYKFLGTRRISKL